jgi:hypothetical protein
MKATYATMVGNICLDKAVNEDGNPAPITFRIQQFKNGQLPWQGHMVRRGYDTLEQAMKELYCVFLLEMEDHGYNCFIHGEHNEDFDNDGNPIIFQGESGWYDGTNQTTGPEFPINDYPITESEWIDHKITSYTYDNYSVCIVTSNFDLVL